MKNQTMITIIVAFVNGNTPHTLLNKCMIYEYINMVRL
jgi:hypothetical protein